ncbi:MAG: O-methyltransferase [Lachnospiraceae bacterium]|nr:O-methyltransferase [Lachnospiraceae bacterium]MBR2530184.1 O-methyltransferase [Lachnospiraceae bacterium]
MIEDERTAAYIASLDVPLPEQLQEIEKRATEEDIPIIRPSARSLLRFVLAGKAPEAILEIGTAVGFSAIFMAHCTGTGTVIDTIENYEKRIAAARANIAGSGLQDRINLIEGDATDVLARLVKEGRKYGLIFMDAAKAQYISYLPLCKKLLENGGILVSDNVLFDGDIVQSRFAIRRRDRTIHARMREYLRTLTADEDFTTTIIPSGDGITLSVLR